jgi:hypothetical protein
MACIRSRHNFEHLKGTLPEYPWPVWNSEDLQGKSIFVRGEQGHGDIIQFVRFVQNLKNIGAAVTIQVTDAMVSLIQSSGVGQGVRVLTYNQDPGEHFDYWIPLMSIPGKINVRVENLPTTIQYLDPGRQLIEDWRRNLGSKKNCVWGLRGVADATVGSTNTKQCRLSTCLNWSKAIPTIIGIICKLIAQRKNNSNWLQRRCALFSRRYSCIC